MRMMLLSAVLVAVVLVSPDSYSFSKDPLSVGLPEIEIIPGAEWYWAGQHMALNGVPMAVKMFNYKGRMDDVKKYYEDWLKSQGHGKLNQSSLGQKTVLGYQLREFYFSIQMEESGGIVQGKAVVTPTPLNYRIEKKTTLPLPPRSNVLSRLESLDGGRRAETLTADSRFNLDYVVNFYRDQLTGDGWQLFSQSGDLKSSAVLSFQRGAELLQLTAKGLQHNNSQKVQFLINWIK